MLVLTFMIGDYLYGFEAVRVAEVVPPVKSKSLPRAPKFVAGIFNYRGVISPIVDLSMLATDRFSLNMMSTRTIMIDLAELFPGEEKGKKFIGLRAEKVTDMIKLSEVDFENSGIEIPDAPWLGKVARRDDGILQLIRPERLLNAELQKILFPDHDYEDLVSDAEAAALHYPEHNDGI